MSLDLDPNSCFMCYLIFLYQIMSLSFLISHSQSLVPEKTATLGALRYFCSVVRKYLSAGRACTAENTGDVAELERGVQ